MELEELIRRSDPARGMTIPEAVQVRRVAPRRRFGMQSLTAGLALGFAVIVAVGALAVFSQLGSRSRSAGSVRPPAQPAASLATVAIAAGSPSQAAMRHTVTIIRARAAALAPHVRVGRRGNAIFLTETDGRPVPARVTVALLGPSLALQFYDWEASVLTPSGRTVAAELATQRQSASALTLSQGSAQAAPGTAGAGSLSLPQAERLAFRLPRPSRGGVTLLAVIVRAETGNGYFVLRGDSAIPGADVSSAAASTDSSGEPDVSLTFTAAGDRAFQRMTSAVARRGERLSNGAEMLDQHFAIAFEGRILTVPSIDFRQYPDGLAGNGGADIVGDFTAREARQLATLIRLGPLPVRLVVGR